MKKLIFFLLLFSAVASHAQTNQFKNIDILGWYKFSGIKFTSVSTDSTNTYGSGTKLITERAAKAYARLAAVTYGGGGGGSQTPWLTNISAAGYNLSSVGKASADTFSSNSTTPFMIYINNVKAGKIGITGNTATSIGYEALLNPITSLNSAFGYHALRNLNNGNSNTAFGFQAAKNNVSGSANTAVGHDAMGTNTAGSNNVALGHDAMFNATGGENTAIGADALLSLTTGNYSTALGYHANSAAGTTGSIAIGHNSYVKRDSSASYGDTTKNMFHGFGTAYPTARMDIRGNVRIVDGTQGAGKVATSDANGFVTFQTPAAGVNLYNTSGTQTDFQRDYSFGPGSRTLNFGNSAYNQWVHLGLNKYANGKGTINMGVYDSATGYHIYTGLSAIDNRREMVIVDGANSMSSRLDHYRDSLMLTFTSGMSYKFGKAKFQIGSMPTGFGNKEVRYNSVTGDWLVKDTLNSQTILSQRGTKTDFSVTGDTAYINTFIHVATTASSATITPNSDTTDMYTVTALATNPTFAAPAGTPHDGQPLLIRIKDDGTSRTLTWNAAYRAGTDFALPTSTTISKTMYVQFVYNTADSKWDAVGLTKGF